MEMTNKITGCGDELLIFYGSDTCSAGLFLK